jgi:hypothetical protein
MIGPSANLGIYLLLFVALCACSAGEPAVDAAATRADAQVDAASTDATTQQPDGTDADAPPAPPPTALPLGPAAVTTIGSGAGLDMSSATLVGGGAQPSPVSLVFDHFDAAFTSGQLRRTTLTITGGAITSFSPPVALSLGSSTFLGSPSIVTASGTPWLYYVRSAAPQASAQLLRCQAGPSGCAAPSVVVSAPAMTLLSWPRLIALPDGRLAAAFRDAQSRPTIALSTDGTSFGGGHAVGPPGAMPALGVFQDGTLAFTYQTQSTAAPMTSWVTLSKDGASWSAPQRVTTQSGNVHDTALVDRLDGQLELYYIYPAGALGFVLFRRALASDGVLGPEQQVTASAVGEVSKPAAARLPDGRLLLSWAQISARDPQQGWPTQQLLCAAVVSGDASPAGP